VITHYEAILEAFKHLGGVQSRKEIDEWIQKKYQKEYKDTGTTLADMVPVTHGGNNSSTIPDRYRILLRISRGYYCIIPEKNNSLHI
jgi:hypothetical protein